MIMRNNYFNKIVRSSEQSNSNYFVVYIIFQVEMAVILLINKQIIHIKLTKNIKYCVIIKFIIGFIRYTVSIFHITHMETY